MICEVSMGVMPVTRETESQSTFASAVLRTVFAEDGCLSSALDDGRKTGGNGVRA